MSTYYDKDGDCIEVIFGEHDFTGKWIGPGLTVYYSNKTGKIVGVLIEGVKRLIAKAEDTREGEATMNTDKATDPFSFDLYQELASRTLSSAGLAVATLGLCGESGEIAERVKKHLGHGLPLGLPELTLELGDALWYLAAICQILDLSLEDVAVKNIEKLQARYPDGFVEGGGIRQQPS